MDGAVDPVHLAMQGRRRVVTRQMHARQGMGVVQVLGKKLAMSGGDRSTETNSAGNARFALPAGPRVSERIGEMLDGRARDVLKKLAVIRHLTADGLGGRLGQIPVRPRQAPQRSSLSASRSTSAL
jgi:hypothetical protein